MKAAGACRNSFRTTSVTGAPADSACRIVLAEAIGRRPPSWPSLVSNVLHLRSRLVCGTPRKSRILIRRRSEGSGAPQLRTPAIAPVLMSVTFDSDRFDRTEVLWVVEADRTPSSTLHPPIARRT